MYDRGVPTDHEIEQRQLPAKLDPGSDEAHQGEGSDGDHLRTDAGERDDVLRIGGGERSGSFQTAIERHHCEPIRRMSGRRERKGVYEGPV